MAFQLSDFGTAVLDTESVKPVSDVDLDKALLDVEAYGSAVDTIGSAFDESMRVYGKLITASSDINFDSRHLSFAREHLETIFTHYGLGKDKVDLEVGRPTLDTETVYYLSREDVEGSADKKQEGVLTKIKNGIVAFFKWIWNAISGFFKAIGRFFSGLFKRSKDKEKKAEEAVAQYEKLEKKVQEDAKANGTEDATQGEKYKMLVDLINGWLRKSVTDEDNKDKAIAAARSFIFGDGVVSGQEIRKHMQDTIRGADTTVNKIMFFNGETEKRIRFGADALMAGTSKNVPVDKLKEMTNLDSLVKMIVLDHGINKKEDEATVVVDKMPTSKKVLLAYKLKDGDVIGVSHSVVSIENEDLGSIASKFKVTADDILAVNNGQWGKIYNEADKLDDKIIRSLAECEKSIEKAISYSAEKTKKWTPTADNKKDAEQLTITVKVLTDVHRNYFALLSVVLNCYFTHANSFFNLIAMANGALLHLYRESDGQLDREALAELNESMFNRYEKAFK